MLTREQLKVLKNVTTLLKENNIPFQITGGVAAIAYGVDRSMYDIDIDVYLKDISAIQKLFKKYITTEFHRAEDEFFDLYLLTLTINGTPVDIAPVEEAYYKNRKGKRIPFNTNIANVNIMKVFGLVLPIQNKNELIGYKKIIGRDTDLLDIKKMEEKILC